MVDQSRLIGDFCNNNDVSQLRYKNQQNKIGKGRQIHQISRFYRDKAHN